MQPDENRPGTGATPLKNTAESSSADSVIADLKTTLALSEATLRESQTFFREFKGLVAAEATLFRAASLRAAAMAILTLAALLILGLTANALLVWLLAQPLGLGWGFALVAALLVNAACVAACSFGVRRAVAGMDFSRSRSMIRAALNQENG